jgi:competence protein ComEC
LAAVALLLDASLRPGVPASAELVVLDVGHGQAAVMRSPCGANVLFDAGSRGRPDVGRRVLVPALDALGIGRLDLLVISHGDADHLNGAAHLVRAGRVARIAHGMEGDGTPTARELLQAAAEAGVPRAPASRGDVLLDEGRRGIRVEVLGPARDGAPRGSNDGSLVIRVTIGGAPALLLPGDVESDGIRALLAAATDDLRHDVLVLPHHGNRDPLLGPLLFRVRPALAVASRGAPFPEGVVPALAARAGADLLSTWRGGAVRVRFRSADGAGRMLHASTFVGACEAESQSGLLPPRVPVLQWNRDPRPGRRITR